MRFDEPRFRYVPAWIWNLGIVLLVILMIVIYARQPERNDEQIEFICKGLEQGASRADVQKCIEDMKK
jgi:hypothetical protein